MTGPGERDRRELLATARRFHAKKSLGQNFLIDPGALRAIASAAAIQPGEQVIEIGPGLGFLTEALISCGARVTAVDLDAACVHHLKSLGLPGLTVVHGDFLRFDLDSIAGRYKIVGNVPYQITALILARIFGEVGEPAPWLARIERVVLTVQLEVAERLVARPGTKSYSQITLLANYMSRPEIVAVLPSRDFFPEPEVKSAVVRFAPLPEPSVRPRQPDLMRKLIRAGFSRRRKMLKNNLTFAGLSEARLGEILRELSIDPQARAERLTLEQFAMLSDAIGMEVATVKASLSDA